MRVLTTVLCSALLALPAAAWAQAAAATPAPPTEAAPPTNGGVDVGAQFTSVDGDEARYQRYRDLRNGVLVDGFHITHRKDAWTFNATATHVGYRDQKYTGEITKAGKLTVRFSWDQIPLFYSAADSDQFGLLSATPYTVESPGVSRLPDSLQSAVQATPSLLNSAISSAAQGVEIRQLRKTADFAVVYHATTSTDLLFHLVNTMKSGEQPWAATFGFSNAIELPGPLDHRTTDITGQVQWSNERGTIRAGYDGSFFSNNVPTLVWDNPLRVQDGATGVGPSQGRMPLSPDNSTNGVSATTAWKLGKQTRVFGNLSFSKWSQDSALVPYTINTLLPVFPLERQTADVSADVTGVYAGLNSRPNDRSWLTVRYKLYDYDNKTPEFPVTDFVNYDTSVAAFAHGGTDALSYKRQYFDADYSYNIAPFTALKAGYGVESDKRTFRQFESTKDQTFRMSLDTTGATWLMLRAQYNYSKRTGNGLDEEVFDAEDEGSALPRQFDIADRNRNRVAIIATVNPREQFSMNFSGGYVKDEYVNSAFGLQNQDGRFFSVGADYSPQAHVDVFADYGYEKYGTLQKSRQANPGTQEFDTTRDWTTDGSDHAHTFTAGVSLKRLKEKVDADWMLEYSNAADSYTYGLAPNQTIYVPPAALKQLPGFSQDRTTSNVNVMYYISRRVGLGVGWLYETFNSDDWAWTQETLNALSLPISGSHQIVLTRYAYRPYTGNTGFLKVRYLF
jgi:MtrB/PioB family decaheme-associated outer membrane protein